MQLKLQKITDFMSWFVRQYKEVLEHTAKSYPFRIVDERRVVKTGDILFTIQFIGKSTCPKITASEIAADAELIKGFSPEDVKRIMESSITQEKKLFVIEGGLANASYKIINKNINREDPSNPTYLVEYVNNLGKKETKMVSMKGLLALDNKLLKFPKNDIYEIAFHAGLNSAHDAQDEIQQLNK
jgi:hypothetical protein